MPLDMTSNDQQVIRLGLEKALERTGAWILSGGSRSGVMELAGSAAAMAGRVCVGIASWGAVLHHEKLSHAGCGQVTKYPWCDVPPEYMSDRGPTRTPLDSNHTHFILVDDGKKEFMAEIVRATRAHACTHAEQLIALCHPPNG